MTDLRISEDEKIADFWQEHKKKVLMSTLFEVGHFPGIPSDWNWRMLSAIPVWDEILGLPQPHQKIGVRILLTTNNLH